MHAGRRDLMNCWDLKVKLGCFSPFLSELERNKFDCC